MYDRETGDSHYFRALGAALLNEPATAAIDGEQLQTGRPSLTSQALAHGGVL